MSTWWPVKTHVPFSESWLVHDPKWHMVVDTALSEGRNWWTNHWKHVVTLKIYDANLLLGGDFWREDTWDSYYNVVCRYYTPRNTYHRTTADLGWFRDKPLQVRECLITLQLSQFLPAPHKKCKRCEGSSNGHSPNCHKNTNTLFSPIVDMKTSWGERKQPHEQQTGHEGRYVVRSKICCSHMFYPKYWANNRLDLESQPWHPRKAIGRGSPSPICLLPSKNGSFHNLQSDKNG